MATKEPIAIVGMGCRFPGGANSPQSFWRLLFDGVDAITEVPEQRWNAARFYHSNPGAPGRMVTRWGGFVDNADTFDAAFFGIAPREAACIDPQHRWLLETTWEAIEDAGLPPELLAGSRTAVFVGISDSDYPTLHQRDTASIGGYTNIGSALSIAANRISYLLNLRGPSVAVDTACSSSLVALHLAVQNLWSGECDQALVGGANALLLPETSIGLSQARMLSPRGRCRAFSADADGYVRAEGAAAILLMPLRTARALRLQVRGLLLATASNQDGHSSSLTVPNQQAQEEMIRLALQSAGICPRDVVYVEAHGTGTPVGDPIEARALASVLSEGRRPNEQFLIGSVKTNIGHLESASGMAGLIKAVLILEERTIPPSLHFAEPNPLLPVDRVKVPVALTPLPSFEDREPLVAVNSFGFGGSNAHVVLAPAPSTADSIVEETDEPCIFPLSARSPKALTSYAGAFAEFVAEKERSFSLRDLCAATALGKSHHPIRQAFVADSIANLQTQLLTFAKSTVDSAAATAPPKIAFVFSGQGPQWWAMGRQLYRSEKAVREFWERCDAICQKLEGLKLLDALLADEASSRLNYTDVAQPALFTLQASLVELWRHWGIEADAVIGHSSGEATAAWAAGICSLEEILRIMLARGRWMVKMHGLGRMLAASIPEDEARRWEQKFPGRISIAGFNAPGQVTLSGEAGTLEEIASALKEAQIFHRFLRTDYAFHSAQMDSIENGLRNDLAGISGGAAKVPMVSTVTGEPVRGPEIDVNYWWRNVREPVRFAAGIAHLLRDGCTTFLEIGPHPVMAAALAEIALAQESPALSLASLRRGEDERSTMLRGLSALYRNGARVQWDKIYSRPERAMRLPVYPWQRQRLWHESPDIARELRSAPSHPLLGDRQPDPQPTWINRLDARLLPWLSDHRLAGSAVLPAAAYIEMATAAVLEFLGSASVFLEKIRFHHLLFLPEEQPIPVCVRLDPAVSSFQIFAAPPETPSAWKLHAEGLFRPGRLHVPPRVDMAAMQAKFTQERDPKKLYRELSDLGQVYGASFQELISLRLGNGEALAEIAGAVSDGSSEYVLFPPALDSSFHPNAALHRQFGPDSRVIVASVRQLRVFQPLPARFWSHVRITERSESAFASEIILRDDDGAVLAQINGLTLRPIEAESSAGQHARKFYQMGWQSLPQPAIDARPGEVLIFCDRDPAAERLVASLWERNIGCTLVFANATSSHANGSSLSVNTRRKNWAAELWNTLAARGSIPNRILYLWTAAHDPPSNEHGCSTLLALAQARLAAAGAEMPARWLVVTRGAQAIGAGEGIKPAAAAVWGFVRTIQSEQPHWNASLVDIDDESLGKPLLDELFAAEVEPEVLLRGDQRWGNRLQEFHPKTSRTMLNPPAYSLEVGQTGRADSLEFHGRARRAPGPGEVEIEVAAAALNFRDLMKVLGIYPLREGEPALFGDECSGRVLRVGRGVRKFKPGDRVMVSPLDGGTFCSHLVESTESVWKIPETLGFVEAASIPVVFGTAYHGLITLARLKRDETVLIHAATGGVGLAAVQLAQQIGATIFATAGNEEKRAYLRSLGVSHVMDSRTLDFADEILRLTNGRGVDVVLNSLAGAFQQRSLAVCAPHGRFIEIGKRDLFENKGLPLAAFQRSLSFSAFDLLAVRSCRYSQKRASERFFSEGFASGRIKPIRCTTFPARDAIAAFRLMQSAQHIGKIVLDFDAEHAPEVPAEFWPDPEGTYLITGGLNGFGLATARWLAERGALHLALVSRRGVPPTQEAKIIDEMRTSGVSVATLSVDVADSKALAAALRRLDEIAPPLRGIFHAAAVFRDRALADMTQEDLATVLAPKVRGAWNLHEQTQDLSLDCFVLFSSLSAIIGAPGQANYAAANAFLDALAHYRRGLGLPALSVNWGQISDVGTVADHPEVGRFLNEIGVRPLSSQNALATLARLIASSESQVGVMDVDWENLTRLSAKFGTSPVFRDLVQAGKSKEFQSGGANDWRAVIRHHPLEEQVAAVSELIIGQLAATLGMAAAEIDPNERLTGMDSLMAVELKVRLESHAGCTLPIDLFNAELTPARLADRLLQQMNESVGKKGSTVAVMPVAAAATLEIAAPLLRMEETPLVDLIRAGKIERLTAAALMSWPDSLFEQSGVPSDFFFQHLNGRRVLFNLIFETSLGSVGIFMLPMRTSEVKPGASPLLSHVLDGVKEASEMGAKCVALTGLIATATNYGAAVQAACAGNGCASLTTGHNTTIAAVMLNLAVLLDEAGREMEAETVMFYGIGSIGLGALRLMLDVLPHPAELHLCDPFRSADFFAQLETTLREEHHFEGAIRVLGANFQDCYDATVIVGATNTANVLDVDRLAPGTLMVDDSAPHCLNGPAVLARFRQEHDILFTEGGFVRSEKPMPRITHVPESVAQILPAELPELFLSFLTPHDITACILSALLSARYTELSPTIGLAPSGAARSHWNILPELGFTASELNYEGTPLDLREIAMFRRRFGKVTDLAAALTD